MALRRGGSCMVGGSAAALVACARSPLTFHLSSAYKTLSQHSY
jgi:hypothetical protein